MKNPLAVLLLFVLSTAPIVPAQTQTDYLVGAQDVLTITVFGEAEFSGKYTVEQDGTFTFPQLGRIKAGGVTLRALEQEIQKKLADGYLRNPQVAVAIESYKSQQILVLGEVRSPGPLPLNSGMTLLEAIAKAGSPTPTASDEAMILRPRQPGGATTGEVETEILRVNIAKLQAGDLSLNVALRDGDTVNVPKSDPVYVYGEVKSPNAYHVPAGTTVLQAITLAGGLTPRGSSSRIKIKRTVNGIEVELEAKLIDIAKPGDTIIVGPRRF